MFHKEMTVMPEARNPAAVSQTGSSPSMLCLMKCDGVRSALGPGSLRCAMR
jgi:hypothetical protein